MKRVNFATQAAQIRKQAAALLVEDFDEPRGWPSLAAARKEVGRVIADGFAIAMLHGATLLDWVGGLPEYHGRVWELHPMVVRRKHRRRGVGRVLVEAFESEARKRCALTITLGTDDGEGRQIPAGPRIGRRPKRRR
jgi:aminoglycoside 6'-N-acetyltransferase I